MITATAAIAIIIIIFEESPLSLFLSVEATAVVVASCFSVAGATASVAGCSSVSGATVSPLLTDAPVPL